MYGEGTVYFKALMLTYYCIISLLYNNLLYLLILKRYSQIKTIFFSEAQEINSFGMWAYFFVLIRVILRLHHARSAVSSSHIFGCVKAVDKIGLRTISSDTTEQSCIQFLHILYSSNILI